MRKKDRIKAIELLEKAVVSNPDHAQAHAWLSKQYTTVDKLVEAEKHADRAVELGLRELGLLARAEVKLKKGDLKEAASVARSCSEEFPKSARANHILGIILWKEGRRLDALHYLEQAVTLEPQSRQHASFLERAKQDIKRQPTISLCMMVKNEEDNLGRLLSSVEGIVDEIIVVDTGSTDKTIDIAKQFDARLYDHPWFDDFSGMRNITINYAKGDWILILDADEELDEKDKQLLRNAAMNTSVNGISVMVHNYMAKGTQDMQGSSIRMFKNDGNIHYEGIVHNNLIIRSPVISVPVTIHHFGYDQDQDGKDAKFKRTSSLLHKVIEEDPTDYRAHFYLMKCYGNVAEIETAIEMGERFLELLPEERTETTINYSLEAYYLLTLLYLGKGDMQKALFYTNEGLHFEDRYPDFHYSRARIEFKKNDFPEAKKHALRALEYRRKYDSGEIGFMCIVHRTLYEIYSFLGTTCYEMQEYEESQEYCRQALEINPDMIEALMLEAKLFLKEEHYVEAEKVLKRIHELEPETSYLQYQFGRCYLGQEKFDDAYSEFLETTKKWPDFASAHHYLGKIEMKRHDFIKAEEALRKASGLDSLKIDLLNEFALVLEHNGRIHESIEIFERMDRLDSKIAGLKNKIGELAFHIGENNKAKEYFQLEIELYPGDAVAYSNLGTVLAGEGKVEQALTCLSKSLEINPHNERAKENYLALQQSL